MSSQTRHQSLPFALLFFLAFSFLKPSQQNQSFLAFLQGGLVNNIEHRVQEAQEYVEQAKESVPKCKKFKKTSKRVRDEMHTFLGLTCYLSSPLSTFSSPLLPTLHRPHTPPHPPCPAPSPPLQLASPRGR